MVYSVQYRVSIHNTIHTSPLRPCSPALNPMRLRSTRPYLRLPFSFFPVSSSSFLLLLLLFLLVDSHSLLHHLQRRSFSPPSAASFNLPRPSCLSPSFFLRVSRSAVTFFIPPAITVVVVVVLRTLALRSSPPRPYHLPYAPIWRPCLLDFTPNNILLISHPAGHF